MRPKRPIGSRPGTDGCQKLGTPAAAQSAMPSIALPATAADRRSLSTNAAAPAAPQLQPRISTSLTDVTRGWIDTFWQPLTIGQSEDLVVGRMLDWGLFRRAERWRWMASNSSNCAEVSAARSALALATAGMTWRSAPR